MANALLPPEEQKLTPEQVVALDKRRHKGQLFLIIGGMLFIFAVLLSVWAAQDLIYSPGFAHPMSTFMFLAGIGSIVFILLGISLRRGNPEFF
jgi:uncharacterized integral membrane protein